LKTDNAGPIFSEVCHTEDKINGYDDTIWH
jgi:hypothetical protein